MTVKELIELLKKLPPDLFVGRLGHYGEFRPMIPSNFTEKFVSHDYKLRPLGMDVKILAIEPPDIGPEPD